MKLSECRLAKAGSGLYKEGYQFEVRFNGTRQVKDQDVSTDKRFVKLVNQNLQMFVAWLDADGLKAIELVEQERDASIHQR